MYKYKYLLSFAIVGSSNEKAIMKQRVAAKAVIVNKHNEVLVLRKSQDDVRHANKSGRYNLPGGKIEPGESLVDGLFREVKEEVGLILKNISSPFFAGEWYPETPDPLQIVGVFYATQEWEGDITLNDEHDDFKWITRDEAEELMLLPEDKAVEAYFGREE